MSKTYSELMQLPTIEERFEYLKLGGSVGEATFGSERYLNQILYHDSKWKEARRRAILRNSDGDNCFDLGLAGYPIRGLIFVHHINRITKDDILRRDSKLFDPENLICCSKKTHDAIHYGDSSLLPGPFVERKAGDTCPWKKRG